MYVNPEKYAVMARYLENECVRRSFPSERPDLDGGRRFQIMADNIGGALAFRDSDGAFRALCGLYPRHFELSGVYRIGYAFKGVNDDWLLQAQGREVVICELGFKGSYGVWHEVQ